MIPHLANLIFDSEQARRTAARSFSYHTRALLYRASDILVDVILVDAGAGHVPVMFGQIVCGSPPEPAPGACIGLGARTATTDDYGQFAIELAEDYGAASLQVKLHDCHLACPLPQDVPVLA